jgi:hypothetical protein
MRGLICLLWICLASVKCTYRTHSMLLKSLACRCLATAVILFISQSLSVNGCIRHNILLSSNKSHFVE